MSDYVRIPQARTRKEYLLLEIRRLQSELAEIEARGFSTSVGGFPLWTSESPTKPGYYWIRNYARRWTKSTTYPGPHMVKIKKLPQDSLNQLHIWLIEERETWPLDHIISAEWYGPIEPPE